LGVRGHLTNNIMIQGETLPIVFTIDDDPTPDLTTMQDIEVAVMVNNVKQLLFKATEVDQLLQVIVDQDNTNQCTVTLLPEQTVLFPNGQVTAEIKTIQSDAVIFKSIIIVDYCYLSNT
jgi:hypothetical protein